jgi:replicative DNA helicase
MDELRRVPHNMEAEQAVIGSILLDPRCIPDVIELLDSDDFYLTAHQEIYDAVYVMFSLNEVFDPVTLQGKMRERGTFDESSTAAYMDRLLDLTPTAAHVKQYAALVRQSSLLRKLDSAASEISNQAREPGAVADNVLDSAEQSVYDIRQGREISALHGMPSVLMDVYKNIKELSDAGGKLPGIPSGMTRLDGILGGLLNNNLIIIASRPGVGKTAFMLGIAAHAVRAVDKTCVFFSLEMSRAQLVSRLLSGESGVDAFKLMTGALTKDDWRRIGEATASLSELKLLFNDNPGITVGEMKAQCRRVKNLGLVIIDYLQLIDVPKSRELRFENRVSEVGHISRSLHNMAKELGVPIVCAAQLRRESERNKGHRPLLSDLRESGNIEQDADSVLLLHRESAHNREADATAAELIVAKNRHGRTDVVDLYWSGETTRFTESETRYEYED